ncbi:hypothetical protein MJO29_002563 [Puccinia striiformis f. sp. tritici]|nr:hypothetical protein MJO29_002563 [Puccinia striiformis f. sp. tritici]
MVLISADKRPQGPLDWQAAPLPSDDRIQGFRHYDRLFHKNKDKRYASGVKSWPSLQADSKGLSYSAMEWKQFTVVFSCDKFWYSYRSELRPIPGCVPATGRPKLGKIPSIKDRGLALHSLTKPSDRDGGGGDKWEACN